MAFSLALLILLVYDNSGNLLLAGGVSFDRQALLRLRLLNYGAKYFHLCSILKWQGPVIHCYFLFRVIVSVASGEFGLYESLERLLRRISLLNVTD